MSLVPRWSVETWLQERPPWPLRTSWWSTRHVPSMMMINRIYRYMTIWIYPPTPADSRGSTSEKQLHAASRTRSKCQSADARPSFSFMVFRCCEAKVLEACKLEFGAILVASESNVRHPQPLAEGTFRPSVASCFGVASGRFGGLWKLQFGWSQFLADSESNVKHPQPLAAARYKKTSQEEARFLCLTLFPAPQKLGFPSCKLCCFLLYVRACAFSSSLLGQASQCISSSTLCHSLPILHSDFQSVPYPGGFSITVPLPHHAHPNPGLVVALFHAAHRPTCPQHHDSQHAF